MVMWHWKVDDSDKIINFPMPLNNLFRILYEEKPIAQTAPKNQKRTISPTLPNDYSFQLLLVGCMA